MHLIKIYIGALGCNGQFGIGFESNVQGHCFFDGSIPLPFTSVQAVVYSNLTLPDGAHACS